MSDATPSFVTQVKKPGEQVVPNGTPRNSKSSSGATSSNGNTPAAKATSSSSLDEDTSSGCFSCFFWRNKRKHHNKNGKNIKKHKGSKITDSNSGSDPKPGLPISKVERRNENGFNSPRVIVQSRDGRTQGQANVLLPPQSSARLGRKCLVLDLDETLVHSSFQPVDHYDFVLPVAIEDVTYTVYVAKRPGVDEFMQAMGEIYEIVIFTASLSQYADPVLDLLDIHKVIDFRLFREHCTFVKGSYVKDMGRMGRPIQSVMIMDNSPYSYAFNPENAIPCESWFDDQKDRELLDFIPVLRDVAKCDNVITELEKKHLNGFEALMSLNANVASEGTSEFYSTEYTTDSEGTSWTESITGSSETGTSTGSVSTNSCTGSTKTTSNISTNSTGSTRTTGGVSSGECSTGTGSVVESSEGSST